MTRLVTTGVLTVSSSPQITPDLSFVGLFVDASPNPYLLLIINGWIFVDLLFTRYSCCELGWRCCLAFHSPSVSQCLLLGPLLCVTPFWAASHHKVYLILLPLPPHPVPIIPGEDTAPYLPSYSLTHSRFPTKASRSTQILFTFPKHSPHADSLYLLTWNALFFFF